MTTPGTPTPAPIEWANLIQAGRDLLSPQQGGRPPSNEHIPRAVSNSETVFCAKHRDPMPESTTSETPDALGAR